MRYVLSPRPAVQVIVYPSFLFCPKLKENVQKTSELNAGLLLCAFLVVKSAGFRIFTAFIAIPRLHAGDNAAAGCYETGLTHILTAYIWADYSFFDNLFESVFHLFQPFPFVSSEGLPYITFYKCFDVRQLFFIVWS